jgi:hypothetical protein
LKHHKQLTGDCSRLALQSVLQKIFYIFTENILYILFQVHFDDEQFEDHDRSKKLLRTAVPTLFSAPVETDSQPLRKSLKRRRRSSEADNSGTS